MPSQIPGMIEHPPPGGGEQPGPPGALVADERGKPPDHRDPGLRGDVLGRVRDDHPEIADERGVGVAPEDREMLFAPALGSRKYGREVVAHHMLSIDTHATSAQRNHSGRCYHKLT